MSGSITFQAGPFQGWTVSQETTRIVGRVIAVSVTVTRPMPSEVWEPLPLTGEMIFQPGVDGFHVAVAAERDGGPVRYAELLDWVIEANARALARRRDLTAAERDHWQQIIDAADDSRADYFARQDAGLALAGAR